MKEPLVAVNPPASGFDKGHGLTHGLNKMESAVATIETLGVQAWQLPGPVGQALAHWRQQIIDDLGGEGAVSEAGLAMIDVAARSKLLLDTADRWLLSAPGRVVNQRKRALYNAVIQRQQLAESFTRAMIALGLRTQAKPGLTLEEYTKKKYGRQQ